MAPPRLLQPRSRAALLAFGVALIMGACSQAESDEKVLASAVSYLEKKDVAAATIQLKSLLQRSPNSAEGRLLLGRALLQSGDPVAALVELNKALELGVAEEQAAPDIARSMLLTGEHGKLLQQYGAASPKDPKALADLTTSLAVAHAMQGDKAKAEELTNRALQAQPMYASALIVQARLKAADKDVEGALLMLEDVLTREPDNERAGVLRAELLALGKRDRDGAEAAYRKVLSSTPTSLAAHVALIGLLRDAGKADAAKAQLGELRKVAPNHPETVTLLAQQHFIDGEYQAARELNDRLLKALPDNPKLLLLAGATEYRLKSYVTAEGHLARALKNAPGAPAVRQLLAQTYLRMGQPNKALEVVAPLTGGDKPDGGSLALAGEAFLALGDARRADEAFKRAAQAAPDDPRVRTAAAIGHAAQGLSGESIGALEAAAAADKGPRGDLALISARMRTGDTAGALKAVDTLAKKTPDRPLADLLRGRILMVRKDTAGAKAAFEAALGKDPKYFPAVAGLASIDIAAGKPEEARKRFEALIQADPSNYQAHAALAEMTRRAGGTTEQVTTGLQAAVKANPTQIQPRLMLIDHLLRNGDAKGALVAAQDATAALPASLPAQEALGRTQIAAGEVQQAVTTLSKLVSQQPREPRYLIQLAEAQASTKDAAAARRSLERALELDPRSSAARRSMAALALQDGRVDDARSMARELQKSDPKSPAGHTLEGDIARQQKDWPAAAAAYRAALGLARTSDGAVRLHQALLGAGQKAEADRFAADWRKQSAADVGFRFYLGDIALAQKEWAVAESHYRSVLDVQPNNALALNNVAFLLAQQGKPGAVAMAERATTLMPNQAALLDTLATALASENQLAKAIEVQKRAVALAPKDGSLRLALARHFIKAGEKVQARAELEDLSKLGDRFPAQAEVARLLEGVR